MHDNVLCYLLESVKVYKIFKTKIDIPKHVFPSAERNHPLRQEQV